MSGKKFEEMKKLVEDRFYEIEEACELLKKTNPTKFDASCEVHLNLGLDPKHADQNIRTTVGLPNGTGKDVRVVAFVDDGKIKEALDAGAIKAGTEELITAVEGGFLDFDVAIATPDQMKLLGKIAKVLGQKKLMPNPKAGTVTLEVAQTIQDLKKGKVEIRLDKLANVHNIFGKVSFETPKLVENLKTIIKTIKDIKPSASKGTYVKSITITTSMGPSIKINTTLALEAVSGM
jgi:large subunit ribosomal protein L1